MIFTSILRQARKKTSYKDPNAEKYILQNSSFHEKK